MTARDTILAAVRAGLGTEPVDPARVRQEATQLLKGIASARPALASGDVVDLFAARVVSPKVNATLDRIDRLDAVPAAVRRYLEAHQLPLRVAVQPTEALQRLDWQGFELRPTTAPDEQAGVGLALWGIAETGTVVFHSSPDTAILAHFLPLHHVIVVRAETIVPYLEDWVQASRARGQAQPRNVNLITGASGTTDIEGSLVLGAHGPKYLHLVIVDAPGTAATAT